MRASVLEDLFHLTGRTALITGAARGIGLETARMLGAAGAAVVLVDRDAATLADSAEQLVGEGVACLPVEADITDAAALDRFVTTGFDASAQADLAAKSAEDGKVVVSEAANADFQKVKMYQITEKGVAVQATMQGYKYWPDDELNGN